MQVVKADTATIVRVGPFVDVGDGFTPETGITLGAADEAELLKHNGAATTTISTATFAAVTSCDGWYDLSLTTAHTDTEGLLTIVIQDDSVCLPVFGHFMVVNANVYDSLYGTAAADYLQVDTIQISGDATAADNAELDYDGTGYAKANSTIGTATALTGKTGFSLASTGLDAIGQAATGMVEIAKAVWDRVLTGATHNINNSAGKKLRQLEAVFVVDSGSAQAGTSTTITLASTASAINNIYNGDRVTIVAGTGAGEHDIITAYDGSTKIATVAETWVVTPDTTSEYELTPASVDVETWQHNVVTASGSGLPDVNTNEVADTAQTAGDLVALLATAQSDLDIVTGSDGTTLATAQGNYAPSKAGDAMTLTAAATSAQLVDDVWDEDISKAQHNVSMSAAKKLRQGADLIQLDGSVSDATPTATNFDTGLTQVDGYFDDAIMIFANGAANAGIGKPISVYVNANGNMTFLAEEAWPVTPVNGDDFVIVALHSHPVAELQSGLATEAKQDIIDTNVDAVLVDTGTTLPATLATILTDTGTTLPALIAALNDVAASDILTTALTESYAADGSAPTLTQSLMLIQQVLTELSIATTTGTVKKIDGTSTAAVLTYNDDTNPTSVTRSG